MSLTIAGAADALNAQVRQYASELAKKMRQGLVLENDLEPVVCDHTWSAPNAEASEVVQPYQHQFTPKLDLTFDAEEYSLFRIKIDFQYTGDDLDKFYDSWMTQWVEDGTAREGWTFPRFIYNEVVVPRLIEDLANEVSYSGEFSAPTPGTPGAASESADGLHTVVKDAITAAKITPITTGTLMPSTIVNQVEEFCDAIPQPYRDKPGIIMMSATNARRYYRNYRDNFGTGNSVAGNENSDLRVDGTNKQIKGYAEMEGSDRIIFAPASARNFVVGYRRGAPQFPQIRWQEDERILKGLAEFHRFYGFKFAENTFVNDQT